ncbi:presequence protease, mitochondrial-like isoform X4 [Dysidea avara]|uniref:presequence protease, mitochondrial-like isoform X2 n=1 Tax=Dysidea avara TaxID=196820 RepID=UPI0033271EA4
MSALLRYRLAGKLRTCLGWSAAGRLSRFSTSCLEESVKLQTGDRLHGYKVDKVTPVSDFNLVAVQLTHENTNTQHLHIAREDSNNVFCVGFRTTPMDSTGVSHILEHTVLTGSRRYPCRDPFFKMLNRSLNTFMNALTYPDYTLYPFSTQNSQDFKNLLSVYTDAVFFPRLREMDFRQEGWRLEHEDVHDKSSQIIYKGVVFNEMKGVFANPENINVTELQCKLLPSHTYSHVSGGTPQDITNLTWENLKEFHKNHYHPSNARFFTYGDFPLATHLEQINTDILQHFTRSSPSLSVPLEPRWSEPREVMVHCPYDTMAANPDKQTTVSVSFLLGSILDPLESLTLSVLCTLLSTGPASPLYQALIDANIGSDFSPATGFDHSMRETAFSIGLQGIHKDDVGHVKDIIWSTLETVVKEGFPEDRIKAVLHHLERGIKYQSTNFGLTLIASVMPTWNHDGDPVPNLMVNSRVDEFKELLKSPTFLQEKIQQYFLDNKHHLTLVMTPEDNYEAQQTALESDKRDKVVGSLSASEKEELYKKGLELLDDQNSPPDIECLPTLHVTDIDPKIKDTTLEHVHIDAVPVQLAKQPTNGITYFRAVASITSLPDELKIYVPLFCNVLTQMGAGDLDHRQFAQQVDLYTGGLNLSPHICSHHSNELGYEQGIIFSSYCLDRHISHMFSLWHDVFLNPDLQDLERLQTLVKMTANNMALSVADNGHRFAISSSSSPLTPTSVLGEMFSGMQQVKFLKDLSEKEDWSDVCAKMTSIAAHVLVDTQFRCALNATADGIEVATNAMDGFLSSVTGGMDCLPSYVENENFIPTSHKCHYQLPFPVNYCSSSVKSVHYTHHDHASLSILARLMTNKYLIKEIREKGGAYGAGAKSSAGVFSFFSYRDPNSVETFKSFENCIDWAINGNFSDQDVDEAKLGVFSQVDSPVSPGNKGLTLFLQGISDELRQQHRDQMFAVTKKSVMEVAARYLGDSKDSMSSAIIGPENNNLITENGWTIHNSN